MSNLETKPTSPNQHINTRHTISVIAQFALGAGLLVGGTFGFDAHEVKRPSEALMTVDGDILKPFDKHDAYIDKVDILAAGAAVAGGLSLIRLLKSELARPIE
jgi:hypothetical protein